MKLLPHRTALYARVSSEQQAQHGTIQSQIAAVQEFAASQGIKIDPDLIFADNGVSGTTLARPKLDALRDKAATGEIDQILILNPDRLARKYAHQIMLVEEFKKLCSRNHLRQSPDCRLTRGSVAPANSGRHLRVRARKDCRASSPRQTSQSTRGKSLCPIRCALRLCLSPCDRIGGSALSKSMNERPSVVRRVFQMLVDQRLSLSAIARKLTEEQIPTRRDIGRWERSVIWAMLRNPAIHGKAAYLKTRVVDRVRPTKLAYDRNFYPKHVHSSTRDRPPEEWITIAVPAIIRAEYFSRPGSDWKRTSDSRRAIIKDTNIYSVVCSAASSAATRCTASPPPTRNTNGFIIVARDRMVVVGKMAAFAQRIRSVSMLWMSWSGSKPADLLEQPDLVSRNIPAEHRRSRASTRIQRLAR